MGDEVKGKIQIKPKGSKPGYKPQQINQKELDDLKQDIKKLKKQVGRLLNIAEHEESIVEENRGNNMNLKLIDGSEESGLLKEITKFQIVLDQDGKDAHFYKSAIVKYSF